MFQQQLQHTSQSELGMRPLSFAVSLSRSYILSLIHCLSLPFTHSHSLTLIHCLSLSFTHTHSLTLNRCLSLSIAVSLSHSLFVSLSHSLFVSLIRCLSLSFAVSRSHSRVGCVLGCRQLGPCLLAPVPGCARTRASKCPGRPQCSNRRPTVQVSETVPSAGETQRICIGIGLVLVVML